MSEDAVVFGEHCGEPVGKFLEDAQMSQEMRDIPIIQLEQWTMEQYGAQAVCSYLFWLQCRLCAPISCSSFGDVRVTCDSLETHNPMRSSEQVRKGKSWRWNYQTWTKQSRSEDAVLLNENMWCNTSM